MILKKYGIILLLLYPLFTYSQSLGDNPLFDQGRVNSVFISIDPDSLNQLYTDVLSDHEYSVQFVYDDGQSYDTLEQTGFRLRGNTSRYSAKKSFKVSFNTFVPGRKYHNIEKLNLNGSHNDPSMVREKLFYDVWNQCGQPTRRSSFVRVYINDEYYGLYTNLEEMDEIWCKDQFGDNSGNLYKCTYPADLNYLGTDPNSYKSIEAGTATGGRAYDLQNNKLQDDYSDLAHFIAVLNLTPINELPCELEKIFDVNAFLRAYALDVSTGNWDDYAYNKNNFFLYHNPFTNQFEFIAYDCDNTFGVDWIGIDWTTRNVYQWENTSENRPLISRLMQVQQYKDLFSYYLNLFINTNLLPSNIDPHIDSMKTLITDAALEDVYKSYDWGYSNNDFSNSFTVNNIDGHTPYGVENFIEARRTFSITQLLLNNIAPAMSDAHHLPLIPEAGDTIHVIVNAVDDNMINNSLLYYSYDSVAFATTGMLDDGLHNDEEPGDGIYGANVPPAASNGFLFYHFETTDNTNLSCRFPFCGEFKIKIGFVAPALVINEFMASNSTTVVDNAGEYDDFVELYNTGTDPIYLGDKYLSDDFGNPTRWHLPDVTLNGDSYILIWTDNDAGEGSNHADFSLNADGEQLGIFSSVSDYFTAIDTLTFGPQITDISMGRLPNGSGGFTVLPVPTPGYNNETTGIGQQISNESMLQVYSNPSNGNFTIFLNLNENASVTAEILTIDGKKIGSVDYGLLSKGSYSYNVVAPNIPGGLYFIHALINGYSVTKKLVVF